MHYALIETPNSPQQDCLVIGILANQPFTDQMIQWDHHHKGMITRLSQRLQENGDTIWQSEADGQSLLLIHCGEISSYTTQTLKKRIADITQALIQQRFAQATICLPRLPHESADHQLQQMLVAFDDNLYQCLEFKSTRKKPHALESIQILLPQATTKALHHSEALLQGIRLARDLANLPANICTPTHLAETAIQLAEQFEPIKTQVMDKEAIQKMGMGALMAVAQGSSQPPQFIEIQYQGHMKKAPIVLVGKGVTFDSGGISLKPAAGMEEMKYDMAGAASVLGTIKACALLQLPIHVIGLIPTTENMPSGSATKPGDIVTSLSGQTIEIVNTDAEGRLILADALTYAERFNPELVIDIATLTGAIIIALGNNASGLFTPDDAVAHTILKAAKESDDPTWRMPLHDAYQTLIDSPLADMVNSTTDRTAGSITAACFLSRYAKHYPWAHLDIAGTAWVSGKKRNATGRPVPLLLQILTNAC